MQMPANDKALQLDDLFRSQLQFPFCSFTVRCSGFTQELIDGLLRPLLDVVSIALRVHLLKGIRYPNRTQTRCNRECLRIPCEQCLFTTHCVHGSLTTSCFITGFIGRAVNLSKRRSPLPVAAATCNVSVCSSSCSTSLLTWLTVDSNQGIWKKTDFGFTSNMNSSQLRLRWNWTEASSQIESNNAWFLVCDSTEFHQIQVWISMQSNIFCWGSLEASPRTARCLLVSQRWDCNVYRSVQNLQNGGTKHNLKNTDGSHEPECKTVGNPCCRYHNARKDHAVIHCFFHVLKPTSFYRATSFFHVLKPTFLDICCWPRVETFLEHVSWTPFLEHVSWFLNAWCGHVSWTHLV